MVGPPFKVVKAAVEQTKPHRGDGILPLLGQAVNTLVVLRPRRAVRKRKPLALRSRQLHDPCGIVYATWVGDDTLTHG